MSKLKSLFSIILALYSIHLSAGVLKGKVTDTHGARLPYATLYLEGTTIGVTTNGNGDFELTVAPGLYKVVCQYMGYEPSSFNVSFIGNETIEHTFILKDQSLDIKEVVVLASTEDPAYPIIRNAIKKREYHLEQTKSFQTSIYFKGVARSRKMPEKFMGQKVKDETDNIDSIGKGVLYLTEEDADYYSDGGKEKTVIHSVHESGNKSGLGFSRFPPVITFYENDVPVLGKESRGFISPISDNALYYYKYKLLGQFDDHGHTIYKIRVTQKRNYEACFNGIIYIVDGDWAIHSLNLTLTKQSGMDLCDTLSIDQLFLPKEKDMWVIKSQVLYLAINLLGFDITANGVAVYNNQKVNEDIPDSVFAGRITSAYDKAANKKDTAYFTNNRPVPLEQDEVRDFVIKDSLVKKFESPAHLDSLRRKKNKFKPIGFLLSGETFSSKEYKNTYTLNSVLIGLNSENMLNYNIVEGYNITPKLTLRHMIDTGKYLFANVAARYGFSNTHFNSVARLYVMTRDRKWLNSHWIYGVEGGKYVYQYSPENPVSEWFNTYSALLYKQNDLKIYERWDAAAFLAHNYGNGLNWFLKADYQQRLPLQNTTDYSFFKGDDGGFGNNAPPHLVQTATAWVKNDAALLHATISYKPGFTYTQYPDYKVANGSAWPRFTLTYDKGIPGIINSVSNFDKWRFFIRDEVSLHLLGILKYNVGCGGFLNSAYVSIPDLMHLYGDRGIGYAAPYLQSFQMAQYYDFSNKEPFYGEAHAEYHLNGLLSNKVPLLRQTGYYFVFGGNAFYARQSDYYTEAFVGIDNIGWKLVRTARIDFVQSWDSRMGHNSGIRFSFALPSPTGINKGILQSEW